MRGRRLVAVDLRVVIGPSRLTQVAAVGVGEPVRRKHYTAPELAMDASKLRAFPWRWSSARGSSAISCWISLARQATAPPSLTGRGSDASRTRLQTVGLLIPNCLATSASLRSRSSEFSSFVNARASLLYL